MTFRGILALCSAVLVALSVEHVVAQAAPAPLTVAAVAADKRLWPKEVITKAPASAVVRSGNQPARTLTIPAGQMVRLLKVERETVKVEYQGVEITMPATDTDLLAGANSRRLQATAASKAAENAADASGRPVNAKTEAVSILRKILAKEGLWLLGLLAAMVIVSFAVRRALAN